jgi:hypothetical protein
MIIRLVVFLDGESIMKINKLPAVRDLIFVGLILILLPSLLLSEVSLEPKNIPQAIEPSVDEPSFDEPSFDEASVDEASVDEASFDERGFDERGFDEPGAVIFKPPAGWHFAEKTTLGPHTKVMVVGKGAHEYPPSINLVTENFSGTLKEYLKIVKEINKAKGEEWKDLGKIKTQSGEASLSQVDMKTEWGVVRLMHVIYLKEGTVYILTAASLKDEFAKFYKEFFNSFTSFKINKTVFELISDKKKRTLLEKAVADLEQAWKPILQMAMKENPAMSRGEVSKKAFANEEFQKKYWEPFKVILTQHFKEMSSRWQNDVLTQTQERLVY